MLFFGKSKKKADATVKPNSSALNPSTVIFTMPEKFLVADKAPFWTAGKIWTIVVVLVLALVGGVYWVVVGLQPSVPGSTTITNTPDTATPTPQDTNTPVVLPDQSTNTPSVDNTTAPDTNTPVNTIVPAPSIPAPSTVLPGSIDSDSDGLTDAEEKVLGTNLNQADSDQDGYQDLAEINSGYNPKGAGKLSDSGIFSTYTSTNHQYHIVYPTSWSAHPTSTSEDEVDFTASPDEFIAITLQPNPDGKSILDWYQALPGAEGVVTASMENVGSWVGVFSPDRRTFYGSSLSRPNDIFVMSYNVGTKTETNYAAIFALMIENLVVTQ